MSDNFKVLDDSIFFEFLNELRESGQINMFGAAPVLADTFGMSKSQARGVLSAWMKSFEEGGVNEGS